jgi:hypothetical protein
MYRETAMDWHLAIARNREALLGIVATLFSLLGLDEGGTVSRISRALHRAALRVLLAAESAVRRLIVIAARDMVVKLRAPRTMPAGRIAGKGESRLPSFPLIDPRPRISVQRRGFGPRPVPRIHVFGGDPRVAALWVQPVPQPSSPVETETDAGPLCRRLQALKNALDDLPRQARRLARWRARQQRKPGTARVSPLRRGPPPGHRRTPLYDIDEVLRECHGLAFDALRPDTS